MMPSEKEFYDMHHKVVTNWSHPYCYKNGAVMEYRLEAEKDIGRYLLPTESVHHHYFSKGGYILAICKNQHEHSEMHICEEAFRYCGHYNWRKCTYCKEYDDPKNMSIGKQCNYHKHCVNIKYLISKEI
jgi:hypothetical protein